MISKDFIIGGDPEFFCKDIETQEYISLIPYIQGTKETPQTIPINGCSQLRDNVSIELNLPPVPEFWMLHRIISDCIEYTNDWLKKINPNYILEITSSATFTPKQLRHPEAREFGCVPAYSIYTNDECYRPEVNSLQGLRTASYHIHYGWEESIDVNTLKNFIFLNDLFLGFPAMYLDNTDVKRKKVYGQLGEHRIKTSEPNYYQIKESKRIEYRTLGAGIHNYPDFVERGIKLIRDNIENLDNLMDLYYNDFMMMALEPENLDYKQYIKEKLINNNHYNG